MKKSKTKELSDSRPRCFYRPAVLAMAAVAFASGVAFDAAAKEPVEQTAQANLRKISGRVLDEAGEPVIGATVQEKGTNNGIVTDADGKYFLNVRPGATIEVSFLGYQKQSKKIGSSATMDFALKDESQSLNEVVVVGFGTQKKINLTGSVATIDSKVLEDRPVANAVQALQGAVPGLQITNNSGALDKTADISVRGTGTIGSSSGSPLILIDGMEGDLNTINPQDIANISVLKDAAASSIYGSRAPFGVILVTTKSGRKGKPQVTYNNNFRWGSPTRVPEMVNALDFSIKN